MILIVLICLAIAACLVMLIGILCSQKLETTQYTFAVDNAVGDVKILFLSDLHCRQFGEDNSELAALVKEQSPDIIAITGDLFSRDSSDQQIKQSCDFVTRLTKIAPVYFSLGNHEADYIQEHGAAVLDDIRKAGAKILDCEYEQLTINQTTFRLGGMSQLAYKDGNGEYDPKAEAFLTDYCDTRLPKVLLSHRPEAFGFKYACRDWDVDLILSGHTHGGLVRLPLIGGLVAPIQGLFPDIYYGEYDFYGTEMIVTSGLAGYYWAPRMFNPPEICTVTLTAKG